MYILCGFACWHEIELPTNHSIQLYILTGPSVHWKHIFSSFLAWAVLDIVLHGDSSCRRCGTRQWFVMVKDVPEGQKAPQQQQLAEQ